MKIRFKNIKMSDNYHEIIARTAAEKQKEMKKIKEKAIERATKIIIEKMHQERGIY